MSILLTTDQSRRKLFYSGVKIMAENKTDATVEEKEKKEPKDVHELLWVEGKGWAVKRQSSEKVIKYFRTKIEATEYVLKVSGNQKTRVVVHLKNGKFQKFDNAVRALAYAKDSGEDD